MKKLVTEKALRRYIRRQLMIQQCRTEGFLSESIDSRIQKRLDALLNDPEYSNVFITIEHDAADERYKIQYTLEDGYPRIEPPKGMLAFRKMQWSKTNGPCANAWEVAFANAAKGWGALLYEIALELAGEDGLVPDRFSVSEYAKAVWDKYETRGDVEAVQLDVIKHAQSWKGMQPPEQLTPDKPEDDCEQLSAVYYGGREGWPDVSISKKYVKRGTDVIDALRASGKLIER